MANGEENELSLSMWPSSVEFSLEARYYRMWPVAIIGRRVVCPHLRMFASRIYLIVMTRGEEEGSTFRFDRPSAQSTPSCAIYLNPCSRSSQSQPRVAENHCRFF